MNLTQVQLARIVGVDRSMISELESGRRCSKKVGLKIVQPLDVQLEELFARDAEMSATKETA